MKVVMDRFDSAVIIGDPEYQGFASVSLVARDTTFLEAEQVKELIEALQDRLKDMKLDNPVELDLVEGK